MKLLKARDTEVRECRLKIEQLIAQLNQAKADLNKIGSAGNDDNKTKLSPADKKKLDTLGEELNRLRKKYEDKVAECSESTSLLNALEVRVFVILRIDIYIYIYVFICTYIY